MAKLNTPQDAVKIKFAAQTISVRQNQAEKKNPYLFILSSYDGIIRIRLKGSRLSASQQKAPLIYSVLA
jgi:hypothetical protein